MEETTDVLELTKVGDIITIGIDGQAKGHYEISTTRVTLINFPRERLDELWNKIQELK